jgi:hypothetical protein
MKTAKVVAISGPLEQVRQRLERWRKTRKRCSSIPDALWAAAVELAREYGVNKTARALRLDYYSLKRRLESGTHPGLYEPKGGAPFIELVTPLGNSSPECIVELEHPRGAKMKIHLKGRVEPDLVALSGLFWSAAR